MLREIWRDMRHDMGTVIASSILLFLLGIGVLMAYGTVAVARTASLEPRCLRAGYPDVKLTWAFEAFCVKRMEQTDLVVPVDSVP